MPKKAKPNKMTYDQWWEHFRPFKNIHLPDCPHGGAMFETYGVELAIVEANNRANPNKVWTLVDTDKGLRIIAGFHLVNRVGYFITEFPWGMTHEFIEIKAN